MGRTDTHYIEHCPTCKANTQFNAVYAGRVLKSDGYERPTLWLSAVECSVCRFLLIGAAEDSGAFQSMGTMEFGREEFPDVPEQVAEAASEAYLCFRAGAFRGAAMLARAVIEATAKNLDITQGTLFSKIDELHSRQHIREYVKDAAHEVRHFGNDMAHGDFEVSIDSVDVELALELMDKVLDEVYQSPAQVERARAKRAAKAAEAASKA